MLVAMMLSAFAQAPLEIRVDPTQDRKKISPLIYGSNSARWPADQGVVTFWRQGGNRMTAYNWETNASNAGSDWHHQNDSYLGGGELPAEVPRAPAQRALDNGATVLLTIPMAGYVSADKKGDGDVSQTPNYLATRFIKSLPQKPKAFSDPPDLGDGAVYQDEFAWLVKGRLGRKNPVWFSLDNEPDIWSSTHAKIVTEKPTYAWILKRSGEYAAALKKTAPDSLIFGPASYGWAGYQSFQGASDARGRFFLEEYLKHFSALELEKGRRLLDVLDVHWYPEARGGDKRITEDGNQATEDARLQAPRSLWDPNYREDSWIVRDNLREPIRLIPRLHEMIRKNYPGTKLAITEWNYGGPNHITGAIAAADVLGIYGREGVFAAALWPLSDKFPFFDAAFRAYRNFDGQGSRFGSTSVRATVSDVNRLSAYAATEGRRITVVICHKGRSNTSAQIGLPDAKTVDAYVLSGTDPKFRRHLAPKREGGSWSVSLPALSVVVLNVATNP